MKGKELDSPGSNPGISLLSNMKSNGTKSIKPSTKQLIYLVPTKQSNKNPQIIPSTSMYDLQKNKNKPPISITFQIPCSLSPPQTCRHDGVANHHWEAAVLRGTHCSELETIAAEGEGRGAIAILAPWMDGTGPKLVDQP